MNPSPENNDAIKITPRQFERHVLELFENETTDYELLEITHDKKITREEQDYQIDIFYNFRHANLDFKVLVECKRTNRAIERQYIQILNDKLKELGCHKGIVVSTCGFQSGAINYAKKHGIALLRIIENKINYEVRYLTPGDLKKIFEEKQEELNYSFQKIELNNDNNISIISIKKYSDEML